MRRHNAGIASVLMLLAAGIAGCTPEESTPTAPVNAVPATSATSKSAGWPLLTEAEVTAVIAKVSADNNKAMSARDTKTLAGFESESAHILDEVDLLTRDPAKKFTPFDYRVTGSRVPGDASGADWWVADTQVTTTSGAQVHVPLLMVRNGATWKLAHQLSLKKPLPAAKTDPATGAAEIVAPDDPAGTLIASPQAVAATHAQFVSDQPPASPLFAGDTVTGAVMTPAAVKKAMKFGDAFDMVSAAGLTYRSGLMEYPVRALRTADGGALIAYSMRTDMVGTHPGKAALIHPRFRVLGSPKATGEQTFGMLSMWWTRVPAKGSGQSVTVLGGTTTIASIG